MSSAPPSNLPPLARRLGIAGAIAMLLAVAIGAFGAHALRARIAPDLLAVYRTGVEYHAYHALGLLALAAIATRLPDSRALAWAGRLIVAGLVLFCGSLYLLAITGTRGWGMVTPFGGTAFILGWGCAAAAMLGAGSNR